MKKELYSTVMHALRRAIHKSRNADDRRVYSAARYKMWEAQRKRASNRRRAA